METSSPIVAATKPARYATGVVVTTPVEIDFSQPVDTGSLEIEVSPDPGGWSAAWDGAALLGRVATLTYNPFEQWTSDVFTLTAAAGPSGNQVLGLPYAWPFTTGGDLAADLPLVSWNSQPAAPDLVVDRILPTPDGMVLVVSNIGDAPVEDDFWVDAYVDPDPVPTAVNQVWEQLAGDGLVWGVTSDLQPGQVLTLTVGGPYFLETYSQVDWPLAPGKPVYAQVDSVYWATGYGAVLENHEMLGQAYNNILGPVVVKADGSKADPMWQPSPDVHPAPPNLPPR